MAISETNFEGNIENTVHREEKRKEKHALNPAKNTLEPRRGAQGCPQKPRTMKFPGSYEGDPWLLKKNREVKPKEILSCLSSAYLVYLQ